MRNLFSFLDCLKRFNSHRRAKLPSMPRPLLCALILCTTALAQPPTGRWDGTIIINTLTIPLRLNFTGDATTLTGPFINGKSPVPSSSGRFADNTIPLAFDKLGTPLDARLVDGASFSLH